MQQTLIGHRCLAVTHDGLKTGSRAEDLWTGADSDERKNERQQKEKSGKECKCMDNEEAIARKAEEEEREHVAGGMPVDSFEALQDSTLNIFL